MDDPFEGWRDAPEHPELCANELHVWGWSLAGGAEELARLEGALSNDELGRMRAFRFAADAERFARARGGLREILGLYLSLRPGAVRFTYGKYGKPSLEESQTGIHFNLSHTEALAVAAFSVAGPVGIDVEERHTVPRSLGDPVFSKRELRALDLLSNEAYTEAFFNVWTRKEAICKAEGLGFHLPPHSFSVNPLPGAPARIEDAGEMLSRVWLLRELPLKGATAGCLALTAAPSIVRLYRRALLGGDKQAAAYDAPR